MSSLGGKCALITGSSRGIGRGIALKLAENGVKVGIHYFRNESQPRTRLRRCANVAPTAFDPGGRHRPGADHPHGRQGEDGIGESSTSTSAMRAPRCPSFSKHREDQPRPVGRAFDSQAKGFLVGAREASALMARRQDLRHHLWPWQPHRPGCSRGRHGLAKRLWESLVRYFRVGLAKRGITSMRSAPGGRRTACSTRYPRRLRT